jgi:hypothetical protein
MLVLALVLAAMAALVGGGVPGGTTAQDEPAEATRGAAIHAGTCADFDPDPVVELNAVGQGEPGEPDGGGRPADFAGSEAAAIVEVSATELDLGLDDLLDDPHAIVVADDEDADAVVACGEIGGYTRFVGGVRDLYVGLREVGDSGFAGVAVLGVDRGNVTVRLFLSPVAE